MINNILIFIMIIIITITIIIVIMIMIILRYGYIYIYQNTIFGKKNNNFQTKYFLLLNDKRF